MDLKEQITREVENAKYANQSCAGTAERILRCIKTSSGLITQNFQDMIDISKQHELSPTDETAIGFMRCWQHVSFEFIICAAIWFNDGNKYNNQPKNVESGFVVSGRRHHNCFSSVQSIGMALGNDKTMVVKKRIALEEREKQGFLTNKDRFVDRVEAAQIAYEAKQINKPLKELYSEDLY